MSGDMKFRENRAWVNATQTGVGIKRLFVEFLAFFDNHPSFNIISYGEGKIEGGVITPATWKAWADTDGSGAVPFVDNAWFVVEAQLASAALDASGTRKWQAKFQVTGNTGFDDCNVADVEYGAGTEANIYCLYTRFCPDGNWVGAGTLDFTLASNNLMVGDFDYSSGSVDFQLHIMGDNDTIIWVGQAITAGGSLPDYTRQKFGYLGEPVIRTTDHTRPEIAIISAMNMHVTGHRLKKGWNEVTTAIFNSAKYGNTVPSFSIAKDNSPVELHLYWTGHDTLGAGSDLLFNGGPDLWTGEPEFMGIVVRQNYEEHNSSIGQLRLIQSAPDYVSEGSLWGDGTRLSVGLSTSTAGGLAVPWPGPTTSPLF